MPLTAKQTEAAKPKEKEYKLTDSQGLYLLVKPSGAKYWRYKYRFAGKEKKLAIGVYPNISLAQARLLRDEARKLLSENTDPSQIKQNKKLAHRITHVNTFKTIADEWILSKERKWGVEHKKNTENRFKIYVYPCIGKRPITDITPMDVLTCLRKIEVTGKLETLRKTRHACLQVFAYAIITGRAKFNPADYLTNALASPESENHLSLTIEQLPEFLQNLHQSKINPLMQLAVKLLLLTGLRSQEMRYGTWDEIDLNRATWTIPAERMKMRRPHLVPLCKQSIELLKIVKVLTNSIESPYIFPGYFDAQKPRARRAFNYCLLQLGWLNRTTAHGFRHTMSTILHEQGYNTAWIELQLAHVDKNIIRGTYNHAQYLEQRREMLQWYADYLDSLELKNAIISDTSGK
ncbi:tyrosine-type recombinase/integrase [Jinshanibacter sp. LJY008]|uniref:Tyrosine-type recombinase/integrase n=1 Tax=Limnobaculum eriocheiris TaxID=2897391 RepID=A0A9X1MX61_9GAMM|nr:integrase arm-type DNA-binding domain-containing protein [Limnobaculum eriocheiris]MCD1126599.1 tyrosine-type recombinase/integrase [Limnobaculum eriocheiris]